MSAVFDDLADLALLEMLSYLSCADALCAFTCVNDRCSRLLEEQGFFRQVNLSAPYCREFHQLLQIIPLDYIETLVIDRTSSPLHLIRWPYLPRLTRLHLRGVCDYDSILSFVILHTATLTHITIQSDQYSLTLSDWDRSLVTGQTHVWLYILENSVEYLQDVSIRLILCFHSFKTFYFAIYLIFVRSTWASIPAISAWIGTPLPFEHHSLVYASRYILSMISLLSWELNHYSRHCLIYMWNYATIHSRQVWTYLKWRLHSACRRCIHSLSSNRCISSFLMNGVSSMYWPHPLSCLYCNARSWSSPSMCGISIESTDQLCSTMIVVSMSNMHSSLTMINLILILATEYHEEVAFTLDRSPVPLSSKTIRSTTNSVPYLETATWVLFRSSSF